MTAADTVYQRKWRQGETPGRQRMRTTRLARGRALEQLAKRYPDEFAALVNTERAALGLPAKRKTDPQAESTTAHV